MATGFQFTRWKTSGDLIHNNVNILLSYTLNNGQDGKFYVTCFLPYWKKKRYKEFLMARRNAHARTRKRKRDTKLHGPSYL